MKYYRAINSILSRDISHSACAWYQSRSQYRKMGMEGDRESADEKKKNETEGGRGRAERKDLGEGMSSIVQSP